MCVTVTEHNNLSSMSNRSTSTLSLCPPEFTSSSLGKRRYRVKTVEGKKKKRFGLSFPGFSLDTVQWHTHTKDIDPLFPLTMGSCSWPLDPWGVWVLFAGAESCLHQNLLQRGDSYMLQTHAVSQRREVLSHQLLTFGQRHRMHSNACTPRLKLWPSTLLTAVLFILIPLKSFFFYYSFEQ